MVGPLMIMKILHLKRLKRRRADTADREQGTHSGDTTQDLDVKKEVNSNVCRACLKEGDIPIYGDDGSEDVSEDLKSFGAIEVSADDSYPKYLCKTCDALLKGAILFRKTAQQSDQILRQKPQEYSASEEDMVNMDDNSKDSDYEEQKPKKRSNYHCKRCSLDFDTFKEYNTHRLSEEHENMRQVCPICNNTYSALYFKKHLELHKMEAPHMCDICGKNFIVKSQFERHRLTHFYELPFKCPQCPYKGRFKESLKLHMRTHTGEKPYICSQCPSRFINKSNLNKHFLTHKGEHDFKCESCGRGFYTKRNLELHFKVDHTGIKDHVCNICGKAFGYRKQMMKHQLKVHKREKMRSGRMPLYLQVESKKQQENR